MGITTDATNGDIVISDSNGDERARYSMTADEWRFTSPISPEDVSNVYLLPEYDGATLNEKWDNLRSEFNAGSQQTVIIPPPQGGEDAAIDAGTDRYRWEVDGPMVVDNKENNTVFLMGRTALDSNGNSLSTFWDVSPSNKVENVEWYGGRYNGADDATNVFHIQGGSRLYLDNQTIAGGACTSVPIKGETTTSPIGELRINRVYSRPNGGGIYLEDISGTVSMVSIENVRAGGVPLEAHGDIRQLRARNISTNQNATLGDRVVNLMATSNGYPAEVTIDGVETGGASVRGVVVGDNTNGTATKPFDIDIRNVTVPATETAVDIWFAQASQVTLTGRLGSGNRTVKVGGSAVDVSVNAPSPSITVNNSGTRTLVNGWGTNAGNPQTGGQFNGAGSPDGVMVRDTTNAVSYARIGGSWVAI